MFNAIKMVVWLLVLGGGLVQADVVKPALVEISIFEDYHIEVEIDLSLEGVMTGIGTQYKNTTDAPNSDKYDELRALEPDILGAKFGEFEKEYLDSFELKINGQKQKINLVEKKIDIIGYKKRPRKTTLTYQGELDEWPKDISWQYGKIHGDSALRYQVFKKDEYSWSQWRWLRDGKPSGRIEIEHPEPPGVTDRLIEFALIGFDHVIPLGWDHILFIIGMALSSLLWRKLLILVSAFTLAHTLTLGLALYGVVEISAQIIEPLIAFSIAYVAIENLLTKQSMMRKTVVVFLFGLIHGLGFATMLQDFEMSADNLLVTLIGFNIGVELAQAVIVLGVVLLGVVMGRLGMDYKKIIVYPVSVMIGLIGIWWGIERLLG